MASPRESNSLCLKRKLVEDYLSEECKSRRIKAKIGSSFDSSAKRCNCCCIRPNLANDCVNFLKSGVPSYIMFYKQGSWQKFPEQTMKSLIEEFSGNKSSVVSVMDNQPVLVDFLSMTMVNLKTKKQRSVAWCDDTGKCFSPSLFFDEEIDDMVKGDAANVQGTAQGIAASPIEEVKQVVIESSPQVPHDTNALHEKITNVERGSEDFLFVQDLFLSGMGPFATPNNLLRVYRYSPNDITAQCGLEAFERQIVSTKDERGDANVRYGWLGSRKYNIVSILINGLGTTGKPGEKSGLSAGVYLSPASRAFSSVGLCDVDEKGAQYMLLCRVILGNMETVEPGSHESFPTSEIYDSGVDDCLNPKCYVMWPSHLSTHMQLEYLVSFKLAPETRNYLLGLKGLWFHPSPKEVAVDISDLKPVRAEAGQGPTTPWISFKALFGLIHDKISPIAMELLFHHYEELKENKITREEMVKRMRIIVGEKILLESLKELHYCPSKWHKSLDKAESSDPARIEAEQMPLDATGANRPLTLNGNHGDLHERNAMAEYSVGALSTKGCIVRPVGMVLKGHDCPAPSSVPETSSSAGSKCPGSKGVEPEGTADRCARYEDPVVTRMPPRIPDGLLRMTSGMSASPGVEVVRDFVAPGIRPHGRASLAPTNASKSHGILAPGLTPSPKACESVVPSLELETPKGADVKNLNAAPRMAPKGREFLLSSVASESPVLHSAKGPDASTSAAKPPIYPPGRGKSPCVSAAGARDFLARSIKLEGHGPPAPRAELKRHEHPAADATQERHRPQATDTATVVHNAPTQITGEKKGQTAQNKVPGPGPDDASGHVVRAAGTLVALSTPREKAER